MAIEEGYYSKQMRGFQTFYNSAKQAELIAACYPNCLKQLLKLPKTNQLDKLRKPLLDRAYLLDLKDILDRHDPNVANRPCRFIYHGTNNLYERQPCLEIVLEFETLASVRRPKKITRVPIPNLRENAALIREGFTYEKLCQQIQKQEQTLRQQLKGPLAALEYILSLD